MGRTKIENRKAQAFFSYSRVLNFMQRSNEPSDIAISIFWATNICGGDWICGSYSTSFFVNQKKFDLGKGWAFWWWFESMAGSHKIKSLKLKMSMRWAVNVRIPNYMKYKLIFMVDERMNDLINSLGRYRFWIYNLGLSHSIGMHLLQKMTETNAIRQTAFHK